MIIILSYVLVVAACVYVLYPLFAGRGRSSDRVSNERLGFRELVHQRRLIAAAVEDLEFDRQTGKLSEEDYAELLEEQYRMKAEVEKKLETASGIDRQDLQRKLEAEISVAVQKIYPKQSLYCPRCGHKVGAEDKFCSGCGEKLLS